VSVVCFGKVRIYKQETGFFFSVSYAELCSEHIKDLLQDECTDLGPSALRHPGTAVQNIRKQEVRSPVSVSAFLVMTFYGMI
jgi:hypothetical protein